MEGKVCPIPCRMLSNIPYLYPLDDSTTSSYSNHVKESEISSRSVMANSLPPHGL